MNAIDIDVGGTFTDLVLHFEGTRLLRKVPTTPYDLSVCFLGVIEDAAKALGLPVTTLLERTAVLRYSTTVAMNSLIERRGPRLGLLTTEGFEDTILIGKGAQWVDGTRPSERRNLAAQRKPLPLISREMIVGVKERIDSTGAVIRPLDEEDAREKVRVLVNRGARGLVVSLLWSFRNPQHEERLKALIREEYRDYHVGSLPIVLASQVSGKLGEYQRTMTAVLDAYLSRSMRIELSAMWDRLRERGYRGSFLMNHNSGGCAELFKTTASRTYNGGPCSGIVGSHVMARQLGMKNIVATDMGGTSFDIGLVVDQSVRQYEFKPVIDRWMVAITMLQSMSIGAGGGSIAWINESLGNRLMVGPRGAGAFPGPACYDLGGIEPTVTDADVVLGYIDTGYYFGGKMRLKPERAVKAIQDRIASRLGLDVVEAATLIRQVVDGNMASAIRKEVHLRGHDPADFVVFAYGGAGPTHAAGFKTDIPRAVMFPFSPVFSAMGSAMMDILHIYEQSKRIVFMEPESMRLLEDHESFNEVVRTLIATARADFAAEGLPVDQAVFALELDGLYGGQVHVKRISSPRLFLESPDDATAVYRQFEQEFSEAFSPLVANPQGGVYLDNFVLRAMIPMPKVELPRYPLAPAGPAGARRGTRQAYWPELGRMRETPVYRFDGLRPGNVVEGPGLVDAEYTTAVVPPGMVLAIEEHGLAVLEAAP